MLINTIKLALCLIAATFTFNAQAVFMAELDETDYEWLEIADAKGISQMPIVEKLTNDPANFYQYEYTSHELVEDLSNSYAPWYGSNDWHDSDTFVSSARITTSDHANNESSPSVKVLLLIVSGLIGIFGLTKDRSEH